jgi:hypothetical protein
VVHGKERRKLEGHFACDAVGDVSPEFVKALGPKKHTLGALDMSGKLGNILSSCAGEGLRKVDEVQ